MFNTAVRQNGLEGFNLLGQTKQQEHGESFRVPDKHGGGRVIIWDCFAV